MASLQKVFAYTGGEVRRIGIYRNLAWFFIFFFVFLQQPKYSFCEYRDSLNHGKFGTGDRIVIKKGEAIDALNLSAKLLTEPLRLSGRRDFIYSVRKFCSISDSGDLEKITRAQKRALRHDLGIKLRAGIRRSTGNLNLYNNSAFSGVSWDIVKGGYLENRLKMKELSIEQAIAAKNPDLYKRKLLSLYRQNFVSYYFARLKIPILKRKLEILKRLMNVKRKGYFSGVELADSLIKIEREIEKTKAELRQYKQLIYTYCTIEKMNFCKYSGDALPPLLSVRFQRVMKELEQSEIIGEEESLNKGEKLLALKHNWKHNVKLEAYLYYNTKGDSSFFSKQGFVAGVNLSVPLGKGYYKDADRLRLLQERDNLKRESSYLENYANLLFREEEEKVSDAVNMWYGMDIALERIRRESYRVKSELKKGSVFYKDYVALLENLKNYLDSELEFVSSEGLLYRRIVNLLTITDVGWKDKLDEVRLTPLGNRFRVGRRYVILKKGEVELLTPDFITEFLYTKGIRGVIMGKNLFESKKGKNLVKVLSNMGIRSYVLDSGRRKGGDIPICLSVNDFSGVVGSWQCVIFEGKIDKTGLKELLKRADILFVPQHDAFFHSEKLGVVVNLKHTISELQLENRLDELYRSGIRNFLFDFGKLMDVYSGGSN